MKIATIKEHDNSECRVSITPDSSKKLIQSGFEISVQQDIGLLANFTNEEYAKHTKLSNVELEILGDSDIITKVQPPLVNSNYAEAQFAKAGSVIIGFMNPYHNKEMIEFYSKKKVSLIAMDLVPRSTKAQSFDALSSQASLIGYRAVIDAVSIYDRAAPMMMTAAGSISAARVLVLGAGVAGLQAIATAKRLGAIVYGYDVRSAAKEQVESLGAKFMHPDVGLDFTDAGGYAKEVSSDFAKRQEEMLEDKINQFDIVITTAMIPGKKAPILLTKAIVEKMRPGSVIVDIAASSGGNCVLTEIDKIVEHSKVKILGYSNFASRIANDASKLYANNIANLILYLFKDKSIIDPSDEIAKAMLLTHDGVILFENKA